MQTKFEQLLDYLINEETDKANELFHEIVVEKSRTIYENLIAEEEDEDDKDSEKDEKEDDCVEENFGGESVIEIGGDATDDLIGDVEFGDDEGGEDDMGGDDMGGLDALDGEDDMAGAGDVDDRVQDLEDALDELKAEFEALIGDVDTDGDGDHDMSDHEGDDGEEAGDEFGADDEEEKEEADESFIREYTEKVTAGHGAEKKGAGEKSVNAKSPLAGENRMGGVTPKLGLGDEKGGVKGGLVNPSPKDMSTGNVNKPGGTSAKQFFSKDSKGHGAEKKGSGESAGNAKSPLAPSHAK